ncbi:MAG: MBL fold metallo-hydrolase [Promethearchaeota archaeon]
MRGLIGEHGLGYHVDLGDKVLLFDVGGIQKTFMHNIHHVEPDISRISEIVLSHGHHDHVGGLIPFLLYWEKHYGGRLRITCHPSALKTRYRIVKKSRELDGDSIPRGKIQALLKSRVIKAHHGVKAEDLKQFNVELNLSKESSIITSSKDGKITIKTTGEIPRLHEKSFSPNYYLIEDDSDVTNDIFLDDQALVIEVKDKYCFILLGCCHAGIENTVAKVKVVSKLPIRGIVGGFHLVGADHSTIKRKFEFLEHVAGDLARDYHGLKLLVRPSHCSGEKFYLYLKNNAKNIDVDRMPVGTSFKLG